MESSKSSSHINYKRANTFAFSYNDNFNQIHPYAEDETVVDTAKQKVRSSPKSLLSEQKEQQTLYLPRLHPKNILTTQDAPKKTIHIKTNKYKKVKSHHTLYDSVNSARVT